MANNVRVTELDFDTIKTNLKTYLRSQSNFTDYDFDASNLSVLLDILAYNTHYNAVLANMVSNEMFLDTALKRSSVVSLAKNLSYVPDSVRSASCRINIQLANVPGSPAGISLQPYTQFNTTLDNQSFTFYNIDTYTARAYNNTWTFEDVVVYQGRNLDFYYTVGSNPGPDVKYVIPNTNVDINTIKVTIQYGGVGSFSEPYTRVTDISEVTGSSRVFFIQENTEGLYEIYFGDNVLGVKLTQNDIIRINYLVSDGAAANINYDFNVIWVCNTIAGEGSGDRTITSITKPNGGSDRESLESIRFRSINNYASQNRAVSKNDYATLISAVVPGAESVNVWGGEQNDPPDYGRTYISIKPKTGYVLTPAEQTSIIENVLKPRGMVTAQHVFVDPTYTEIVFKINCTYTSTRTNLSLGAIETLIYNKVAEFMSTNLNKFNAKFYRSQLEEQIMNLDTSILSVNILFDLVKIISLPPNVRFTGGTLKYPTKIHPNEFRSSYYYFEDTDGVIHPAQVRDVPDVSPPDYEGTGILKAFDLDTNNILEDNVATINYGTGEIVFNAEAKLKLAGYLGSANAIYLYAGVQESVGDITPGFNEILTQNTNTADTITAIRPGIQIDVTAVNN